MLLNIMLSAQGIKGKVVDAETRKPIADVSIYLNGTYQGTSSNAEGNFEINTAESHIPLIISYVGYESLTVTNYWGKTLYVLLTRKGNELHEVTISGNNGPPAMSREEEIKIFLREFIGDKNRECTISNLHDLSFRYQKRARLLTANANAPLIIYNKKLGYKITYFLSSFTYTPMEVAFQGNYFFSEDTIGLKPKELKKVLSARVDTYMGSRMHFIRSLWNDKLKENNFKVYLGDTLATYKDLEVMRNNEKFIRYIAYISINYRGQDSYLRQEKDGRETFVAANGFYDPNIIWSGEMGSQRVGEMLPFEFQPSIH